MKYTHTNTHESEVKQSHKINNQSVDTLDLHVNQIEMMNCEIINESQIFKVEKVNKIHARRKRLSIIINIIIVINSY